MNLLRFGSNLIGSCAAIALVAGCGAAEVAAPRGASPTDRAHRDVPKNLYVTNFANNTVTVYQPGTGTPLRTISDGVKAPVALAFDASGYLYVANSKNSTITVYYPEATKVTRTISNEVDDPRAMAFDNKGNVYVMNVGSGTVTVYKAGTNELIQQIIKGINDPLSIAFDTSDNLYVADSWSHQVTVYAGSGTSRTLTRTITNGISDAQSLAFDSSGRLYVGNDTGGYDVGDVTIYPAGKSDPIKTIKKDITYPRQLALDSSNNLYVLSGAHQSSSYGYSKGYVTVYSAKKWAFLRKISDGFFIADSEALGSSGYLNVANCPNFYMGGSVTIYAPGKTTINRTITNGIACPTAVGFGP